MELTGNDWLKANRRFVAIAAATCALASALPFLFGILMESNGARFLGYPYATDDHMVYAAWMRQAQDGRLLMDNRFTTDAQPGLTVHLYFFVLGLISKLTGIVWATVLAKAGLSALFVALTAKLLASARANALWMKLGLLFAVFGSGLGFAVWHKFGEAIVRETIPGLNPLLLGRLPTDVWQPEGYVFSSMLTNSLFMAALCLIAGVSIAILQARDNWKSVGWGALCTALLMNIHSYDVLILLLVAIGFIGASFAAGQMTGAWLSRGAVIFLGALPPALWFLHVLNQDAVFQARAATETYSPNFRQVVLGYLPLIVAAIIGNVPWKGQRNLRQLIGFGLFSLLAAALFIAAANHTEGYFLRPATFAVALVAAIAAVALVAEECPTRNWLWAWAMVGLVAPYFPALFQRKLAMGLSLPWAILAAWGLVKWFEGAERGRRNLILAFVSAVCCGTSFLWLQRELLFIRDNVSRTTVHALYLSSNVTAILDKLNAEPGKKVVLAMPGAPLAAFGPDGKPIPDEFQSPYLPDLNPIASGFTGAYTYAGHWSETPYYSTKQPDGSPSRRDEAVMFFTRNWGDDQRRAFLDAKGITHLIAPVPSSVPLLQEQGLVDVSNLGTIEIDGPQFRLIRVR
jgi:hypothetical protein